MRHSSPLPGSVLARCGALVALAVGVTTPALPAAPAFDPYREIVLVCTATGGAHVRPVMTATQLCAAFKLRLDAGLGRVTRTAAAMPATGNAIRVELRVPSQRTASAIVTTVARGKSTRWPEITVDVMDRPLGTREIGQLAGEVARAIAERR